MTKKTNDIKNESDGSVGSLGTGKSSSVPRVFASKNWIFTWNNYPENYMALLAPKKPFLEKWCWGEEVGEKCGTPHIQGFVQFKNKQRPIEFLKLPKEIHWIKARKDEYTNFNYCSKQGNNVDTNIKLPEPLKDPLEGIELYEWQKDIINIVNGPVHDRIVYWYWSNLGCKGKTSLAKHLCIKNPNIMVVDGQGKDILYGVASFIEKMKYLDAAIFNIVRDETHRGVSYKSMEKLKDGLFFNGKYESGMVCINPPHVIVFANFEPDFDKLSSDRWVVKEVV